MTTLILSDWNAPPKTVSEAAKWLGVDEHKIYDAINAHELPAHKPNGNTRGWRVFENDLVAWLKSDE